MGGWLSATRVTRRPTSSAPPLRNPTPPACTTSGVGAFTIDEIVEAIDLVSGRPGLVTHGQNFAEAAERVDDAPVPELLPMAELIPLEDGVRQTIERFAAGPKGR